MHMKLLIIGANRGMGRRLVELALDESHTVTALVRNPEQLTVRHDRLSVIKGDIRDKEAVNRAVEDQDAVCITIGINPTRKPVTVFSEGAKTVIEALTHTDANQLICVTGIGAGDSKNHGGFFYDRIFNPLLLRNSNLEWVIVRPGFLTNGPLTGTYRVLIDLAGVTAGKISRADVAHFILNEIKQKAYLSKTPLLTY
jgi:putative NADH-flavin reductase